MVKDDICIKKSIKKDLLTFFIIGALYKKSVDGSQIKNFYNDSNSYKGRNLCIKREKATLNYLEYY